MIPRSPMEVRKAAKGYSPFTTAGASPGPAGPFPHPGLRFASPSSVMHADRRGEHANLGAAGKTLPIVRMQHALPHPAGGGTAPGPDHPRSEERRGGAAPSG